MFTHEKPVSLLDSNWILTYCQPHRVTSRRSNPVIKTNALFRIVLIFLQVYQVKSAESVYTQIAKHKYTIFLTVLSTLTLKRKKGERKKAEEEQEELH